jgi:hypothetical protein
MTFGSIASGGGATFSILSQSIPAFSVSEDEEEGGDDDDDDDGPASGCAALLGIEGILYFGVPRVGVGPTWSFRGVGGARRRSRFRGMVFVQTIDASEGRSN